MLVLTNPSWSRRFVASVSRLRSLVSRRRRQFGPATVDHAAIIGSCRSTFETPAGSACIWSAMDARSGLRKMLNSAGLNVS